MLILLITLLLSLITLLVLRYEPQKIDESNIKKLVRQTARWATAADQDNNGYIANLHATYAMGYLMATREIYTDVEIEKYSGINIRKFETEISAIMDDAIKKLVVLCPTGQPKNQYLASISKEGMLI
jgi:hypothetical protein